MGGHGHDHPPPYTIPDYKIYKVSDVPKLVIVQRALASQGLKDPWLRNEVWRYNEKEFGSEKTHLKNLFFRGFRFGFAAFILTIAGTALYDKMYPSDHHHDDHH